MSGHKVSPVRERIVNAKLHTILVLGITVATGLLAWHGTLDGTSVAGIYGTIVGHVGTLPKRQPES